MAEGRNWRECVFIRLCREWTERAEGGGGGGEVRLIEETFLGGLVVLEKCSRQWARPAA